MKMRTLALLFCLLALVACDDDDSDGDSVSVDVESEDKVSSVEGGLDAGLKSGNKFGRAVANLENLDGNNSIDIAVGAPGDDRDGEDKGAVWILFLNEARSDVVRDQERIAEDDGGFDGDLDKNDGFGSALATLDGLNLGSDDVFDTVLGVGAPGDDDGGDDTGAVWLLALNDEGKVKKQKKISQSSTSDYLDLYSEDEFGSALANVGDQFEPSDPPDDADNVDADNVDALAVGSPNAEVENSRTGVVWIVFLSKDGGVYAAERIPGDDDDDDDFRDDLSKGDRFGSAIAEIGDLDNDNVTDLAVGAPGDGEGAVWILLMEEDGSVKERLKIAEDRGNFFGDLNDDDDFGAALTATGDLDGDGIPDLAVGAPGDREDEDRPGAFWILFLSETGEVLAESKVTRSKNGFGGTLDNGDGFGAALADLGNFDDDGATELDLAVGAPWDDEDVRQAEEDECQEGEACNDGAGSDSTADCVDDGVEEEEASGDSRKVSNCGAVWLLSVDVEAEGVDGVLDADRGSSRSDSLIQGPLSDRELGSPLGDSELASPFRDGEIASPLRDKGLNGPLRNRDIRGLLQDRELAQPLR